MRRYNIPINEIELQRPSPVKHHPIPIALQSCKMIAELMAAPTFRKKLLTATVPAALLGNNSVKYVIDVLLHQVIPKAVRAEKTKRTTK